ncbi:MAG: hypothetical protein U5Q03_08030 [Bacteroidota bacterium]|nr:hypothetical protein [Bacteroidota bacterium]
MPESGTGFINSIDEARQGPQQITGAGGYDAIEFVPPGPDTYYIEFDRLNNSGERNPGLFEIELFDITVYDNNVGEIRDGRLYSKGWQFLEGQAGFDWLTNSATFYVYSNDSIITSVQFDEMEGRAWIMFCNQIGCANTGDFTEDRKSLYEEQAYVPEYPIFVNEPDPVLFPPATSLGQIIGTPTGFAYCDGHIDFNVEVDKAGNAEVILDFEDPYADRTLAEIVEAGVNIITWDGLDDNGVACSKRNTD